MENPMTKINKPRKSMILRRLPSPSEDLIETYSTGALIRVMLTVTNKKKKYDITLVKQAPLAIQISRIPANLLSSLFFSVLKKI